MIRAVKAVSTYRGRDPRDFALIAFGGNGPVHAAHMARELGIKRVVVPLMPGLFSAVGLLCAEIEHHAVHTFLCRTTEAPVDGLNAVFDTMEREGMAQLAESGYEAHQVVVQRSADLRYEGQAYELTVPIPGGRLERDQILTFDELLGRQHEQEYGHRALDEPVEIVNLRVTLRIVRDGAGACFPSAALVQDHVRDSRRVTQRKVYFGPEYGTRETPVLSRWDLDEDAKPGPLIIEEYDATTVVPPGCQARLDEWGNIEIKIG
jgi:N-methylhydantoinase A